MNVNQLLRILVSVRRSNWCDKQRAHTQKTAERKRRSSHAPSKSAVRPSNELRRSRSNVVCGPSPNALLRCIQMFNATC